MSRTCPACGQQAGPLRPEDQRRIDRLTAREREVVGHILAGRRNAAIAEALGISARTVEIYRARAIDKLDVGSTVGLVRFAMRTGLTS